VKEMKTFINKCGFGVSMKTIVGENNERRKK
jgi:hypothetical protein